MMHSSFSVSGISRAEAYRLIRPSGSDLTALLREATRIRDARTGHVITYSRKVFIPLTNLCRDRCGYCTFAREPDDSLAHTMTPEEVLASAEPCWNPDRFSSYGQLIVSQEFRFRDRRGGYR